MRPRGILGYVWNLTENTRRPQGHRPHSWMDCSVFDKFLSSSLQIVFDECHKAKNLCPVGSSKPTKTGLAVLELQNKLPKARVVYASATGEYPTWSERWTNRFCSYNMLGLFQVLRNHGTWPIWTVLEFGVRELHSENSVILSKQWNAGNKAGGTVLPEPLLCGKCCFVYW